MQVECVRAKILLRNVVEYGYKHELTCAVHSYLNKVKFLTKLHV